MSVRDVAIFAAAALLGMWSTLGGCATADPPQVRAARACVVIAHQVCHRITDQERRGWCVLDQHGACMKQLEGVE